MVRTANASLTAYAFWSVASLSSRALRVMSDRVFCGLLSVLLELNGSVYAEATG